MTRRTTILLAVLCAAGASMAAWAVEDTVPVPVHESAAATDGCCCGGETEGCTGDCATCAECTCDGGDDCCCDGETEGCSGDCGDCDSDCCDEDGCPCDSTDLVHDCCPGPSGHGHGCGGCH